MNYIANTKKRNTLLNSYYNLTVRLENLENAKPEYMQDDYYYLLLYNMSKEIVLIESKIF